MKATLNGYIFKPICAPYCGPPSSIHAKDVYIGFVFATSTHFPSHFPIADPVWNGMFYFRFILFYSYLYCFIVDRFFFVQFFVPLFSRFIKSLYNLSNFAYHLEWMQKLQRIPPFHIVWMLNGFDTRQFIRKQQQQISFKISTRWIKFWLWTFHPNCVNFIRRIDLNFKW